MENDNELLDTQNQEEETYEETEETSEETSSEDDKGETSEDYKALYEKEKQAHEKEKAMRQGMVSKLKALTTKKSEPKVQPTVQPADTDRLDRLELRQIDPNLTAEQVKEILLTKKTRGLSDAIDAYNHPIIQSWLKDERAKASEEKAKTEQKEKIEKATPKTQGGGTSSSPARQTLNKEWSKGMGSNLQEVASILEKEILGS